MLLKEKVVVLTGATKGIGKGMALKAAEEGAKVVASGPEPDLVAAIEKEFQDKGYEGIGVLCDVRKKEEVENLMKKAVEKYGRIDALVANAGITDMCRFEDMDEERWDRMISINLKGVYLANHAVLPYLKKNGGGKIVNTGSDCALEGWEFLSSYSAAKFGVRGLTQALAKELGKYNINVNCVCPGIIDTDMWDKTDKLLCELKGLKRGEAWKQAVENIPLGRGGKPEDVAKGVVFLLSEYADYYRVCFACWWRKSGALKVEKF